MIDYKDGIQAYAVFEGKAALEDDDDTTIIVHNADGKDPVTFTTSDSTAVASGTATTIGTDGASSDTLATKALWYAFKAAITGGTLSATLSPDDVSSVGTSFKLIQNTYGSVGNMAFTHTGTQIAAANININSANFTSGESSFINGSMSVVASGSKGTIDFAVDGSELDCTSAKNNQGGVFLKWDTVDNADYYVVYRLEPGDGKTAVPIIATSPDGTSQSLKAYNKRNRGDSRPVQISPTIWIDFPPPIIKNCLEYTSSNNGGSSWSASGSLDDQLGEYRYWVEAVNKTYNIKSNEPTGYTVNCKYKPTVSSTSFAYAPERYKIYHRAFSVSHPFMKDANVLAGSENLPVWTYVSGSTKISMNTDKDGIVTTSGSSPSSNMGSPNSFGYTYKPKVGYVGKDKFTFTAKVFDPDNPNNPAEWCEASEDINIYH